MWRATRTLQTPALTEPSPSAATAAPQVRPAAAPSLPPRTTAPRSRASALAESWAQIHAAGGGPSQLNLVYGSPKVIGSVADVGLYYQDDWSARKNFTLSYGVRWESQTGIADQDDWAPRSSFAYGLGDSNERPNRSPWYGFFYDRFALDQILQADRLTAASIRPRRKP